MVYNENNDKKGEMAMFGLDFSVYKRIHWLNKEGAIIAVPISDKNMAEWEKCGKNLTTQRGYNSNTQEMLDCEYFGLWYKGTDRKKVTNGYVGEQYGDKVYIKERVISDKTTAFFLEVQYPCENDYVCMDKNHILTKWINTVNKPVRGFKWWLVSFLLLVLSCVCFSVTGEGIFGDNASLIGGIALGVWALTAFSIIYRLVLNGIRKRCVKQAKEQYFKNGGRVRL